MGNPLTLGQMIDHLQKLEAEHGPDIPCFYVDGDPYEPGIYPLENTPDYKENILVSTYPEKAPEGIFF